MAKTKIKQKQEVTQLTLKYRLAELPSSQHRAGLAGLILVMQWLKRQNAFQQKVKDGMICKLLQFDDDGAAIELNQDGVACLFDEIYAATKEEQRRNQPLKNKQKEIIPPLREEEYDEVDAKGKTKKKKAYIYPVDVPRGSFLADASFDQSSDGKNGLWVKLWRDMVWSILRGVPATRKPFQLRADGLPADDAVSVWKQLLKPDDFTVDLPSTYFLGAQAYNAENIGFKDRARFQFLLHFWLFAAQIYVPAVVDNEGKRNFVGYAIAIPDIARLEWFCDELPMLMRDRSPQPSGYRPREAVVDLALESALDMMKRLGERLSLASGDQSTADAVFGIDVIHTEKQGNNVRLLSMARLDPDDLMNDEYTQIRQGFWSPLFRRQCLLNLVNHSPWYEGFDALLCTLSYERSLKDEYFKRDVRIKLEDMIKETQQMTDSDPNVSIEPMIFQLVKNYVNRKLKGKYSLEWEKNWSKLKSDELSAQPGYKDYSDKKTKIAKSAFLDIRSRTEQEDFINYFVSTLCSVPQNMKPEAFVALTQALYQDTEKVRTLTLLALSANS
ncbi:type I-MYXAN CRISPR-associated protein Cmx8 [filamentous cyanobacterium LEGE 11480]|uniref:Type I-MYXAN CRISPR-associated protein Cmx8 n=1 Tax=Romeriopsis navalis LEGE 11480 TaxID=2777977 RepID=A0A928Z321_9CYAN|nr:type I-MYXAN CRISPR-associated protein Cmx8 [Romeriopsis navalis]MBE9028728.1 type I-MYXAN CRISPR-associated protein Cmx8 [Romeriopsis navalis LEGE 11480]